MGDAGFPVNPMEAVTSSIAWLYAPAPLRRESRADTRVAVVPAGQAGVFVRQFVERGLDKTGIRLSGAGDITDDDLLNSMGEPMLGIVTAYFYSAAHPSEKNNEFVEAVKQANNGMRANFFGVSGYDGMHLIYEVLKKTNGDTQGDASINAAKGMSWENCGISSSRPWRWSKIRSRRSGNDTLGTHFSPIGQRNRQSPNLCRLRNYLARAKRVFLVLLPPRFHVATKQQKRTSGDGGVNVH
jgi:hypothetical protein